MKVESLFAEHVAALEAYEPPDWPALAAQAGLPANLLPPAARPAAGLVRLDANENPYGPPPGVIEALARFEGYGFYPDYRPLTAAVARYAGLDPQNVVLGNGGDEIVDLAVRLFVAPGEGVVICPPAFGMYAVCTRAHRGRVLAVPRRDDFALDVAGIETLLAGGTGAGPRPKLLFLTSPGNPDGLAIPLDTIRRLLDLPLAVVVDEAYIEFGGQSAVPLLAEHPNLIVLRTFSKWAGLAGLRLGYALAPAGVAAGLARLRPPYNVNAAAVVAGLVALEEGAAEARATIERLVAGRAWLQSALHDLPGAEPLEGQANFVLVRLPGRSGPEVARALAGRGILVRSFADPGLHDARRISVGRPEQNEAFLAALRAILDPGSPPPGGQAEAQPPETQPAARRAEVRRRTAETEVAVRLDLDGTGCCSCDTGLGFLDHMLAQVAAHGLFDLVVRARGDLQVDAHHTVEDVAICLGQALDRALAGRRGVVRMGSAYAPLDEALAHVVVDLSGRAYAAVDVHFETPYLGQVDSDLLIHFLETLAVQGRLSLHARLLAGRNDHHKAEALFKALGRALDAATRLDPRRGDIPSTKGVL